MCITYARHTNHSHLAKRTIRSKQHSSSGTSDLCPGAAKNTPGVCGCDKPESGDSDGDGVLDCVDECPNDPDKSRRGLCGCGNMDQVRHEWTQLDLGTCALLHNLHRARVSYSKKPLDFVYFCRYMRPLLT